MIIAIFKASSIPERLKIDPNKDKVDVGGFLTGALMAVASFMEHVHPTVLEPATYINLIFISVPS